MDGLALAWKTLDSEVEYTCPGLGIVRDDVASLDDRKGSPHNPPPVLPWP